MNDLFDILNVAAATPNTHVMNKDGIEITQYRRLRINVGPRKFKISIPSTQDILINKDPKTTHQMI